MIYKDRADAARLLADALSPWRGKNPLVCATPVASSDAVRKVRQYADDVVCLQTPELFYAVGQFYHQFPQVDDREVVALLRAAGPRPGIG